MNFFYVIFLWFCQVFAGRRQVIHVSFQSYAGEVLSYNDNKTMTWREREKSFPQVKDARKMACVLTDTIVDSSAIRIQVRIKISLFKSPLEVSVWTTEFVADSYRFWKFETRVASDVEVEKPLKIDAEDQQKQQKSEYSRCAPLAKKAVDWGFYRWQRTERVPVRLVDHLGAQVLLL